MPNPAKPCFPEPYTCHACNGKGIMWEPGVAGDPESLEQPPAFEVVPDYATEDGVAGTAEQEDSLWVWLL